MSTATEPPSRASSRGDNEDTIDVTPLHQGYNSIFLRHLTQTLRHSTGYFSLSMGASVFPPSAHWTAEEKDLFFHALARHSALRPDLVAAEIGSKTTVDVCGYIALLRNGAQKSEALVSLLDLPTALEMSDKWIEFEEKQAFVLTDAAAGWEVDRKKKGRKDILRRIKDRKKPIKGAVVNRTWDVRAQETERLRLYEERRAELEEVWEREDALEVLDGVDLQTLDAVARKGLEEQQIEAGLEVAAASPTFQVDANDEPDLSNLTPAEQRRVKKRLYMRRKRAQAAGKGFDESTTRLKPGRKPKATPKGPAHPSNVSSPESDDWGLVIMGKESDPEDGPLGEERGSVEDTSNGRNGGPRGLTRAERSATKFTKYGLDFQHLKEHELDLFYLRRFGGLMFACSHGNLETIKYSVMRLLRAYIDEWLAIVIQQAILAAEQDRRAKGHTELWRTNLDEIKIRHVEHALAILDCKDSKRALLERLEQRIGGSERKEDEDMEDGDLPEPWSLLSREVYPPLINHPCLLDPEFELDKQPIDDAMDPPPRLEASLDAEEAEKVERMDAYNAKRHEHMLWRLAGKGDEIESEGVSNEDISNYEAKGPRVGRQKRGAPNWMFRPAGGDIKSQPFVNTSDEESDSE